MNTTDEWVHSLVADTAWCALVEDSVEVVAGLEDLFAQFGNGGRDRDSLQACPRESTIANAGYAAWYLDTGEVRAVGKGYVADVGDGIRKCNIIHTIRIPRFVSIGEQVRVVVHSA